MPKNQLRQIGTNCPTKMLCTKIHIYNKPPVDTDGCWCQIISRNMFNLSLKIFHWLPLVNSVLKFQIKLGTLKPQSISLFWPFSIYTWNLAPENACGAEHFSHCVFLGQAILHIWKIFNILPYQIASDLIGLGARW